MRQDTGSACRQLGTQALPPGLPVNRCKTLSGMHTHIESKSRLDTMLTSFASVPAMMGRA
jgi:hypothetical protein